jgi:acylphosphatase
MLNRRLRISGRVQGVGFRYAMRHEAVRLGVNGWVRNRSDGSVEALLQGAAEAVETLTAWARRGPPGSRVDNLEASAAPPGIEAIYAAFELRPTV